MDRRRLETVGLTNGDSQRVKLELAKLAGRTSKTLPCVIRKLVGIATLIDAVLFGIECQNP